MEETMETTATDFKNQVKQKIPLAVDQTGKVTHSTHESGIFPIAETFKEIRAKTAEAYDSSIQVVRKNPVKSLAVALGLGLAAGYLLKRR
jgi:ElaB/YqjD/DUF883 family membrane-anchored ribosome-binding protein